MMVATPTQYLYTLTMKDLTVYAKSMFNSYVIQDNGCWLWQKALNNKGYGQVGLNRYGKALAHRVMYTVFKGPIPEGLSLDHLCRTPACVNPKHLEPVTHRENVVVRGKTNACAINSRKTHCKNGHKYTKQNTYNRQRLGRKPERDCVTCRDIRNKARIKQ